jgi:hypothetical protein
MEEYEEFPVLQDSYQLLLCSYGSIDLVES